MATGKPTARIVTGVPKPTTDTRLALALKPKPQPAPVTVPQHAAGTIPHIRIGIPDALPGTHPVTRPPAPAPAAAATSQSAVAALLQPIIDQLNNAATRRSTEGTNAIKGYTSQLAQTLATAGPAGVSAAYDPAQASLATSNAAFADRLQGAGNQSADQLASRLAGINAPGATGDAAAALRDAASGSSNASYGLGNAALQGLISNEADAQAFANKMPGIANLAGLQGETALQTQIKNDTMASLDKLQAQVPGLVQSQFVAEAKAKQNADALAFQKQKQTDLNKWRTDSLAARKTGTGSFKIVKGSDGYYRVNSDGSTAPLGITPPASSSSRGGGKSHLQSKTVNGHVATFDPATGTYYIPGTNTPVDPNTFTKPAKAVSSAAVTKARGYLQQQANGFYASQADPTKPISASAIASAAKNATMTVGDFLANTPDAAKARADAGIGWNQVAPTRENWPEVQQLYLTLVKQYGIPARQAFQIVAGTYQAWGKAHKADYFPKGDAAQAAAYVTVAPTANRQGVALNPAVTAFVGKVGAAAGEKLTIGTGTNHNQYVIGTRRQSAHWTGNAADIPATGANLTKLGQDALIAAGADPAWARKQTGGLYNVGGYQIIFNSNEGGNHFNHLHVGINGSVT